MSKRWLDLEDARIRASEISENEFAIWHPSWVMLAGEIRRGRLVSGDGATLMLVGDHSVCVDEEPQLPQRGRYCLLLHEDDPHFLGWMSIGRTISNDIVINDYTLSKSHARIRRLSAGGGWEVEDQGSTNHSFVDGEKLVKGKKVQVKSGMTLRLGRLNFTLLNPMAFCKFLREMVES
jgi:hypothetical protein